MLSAPHGGRERIPGVPDRTGRGIPKFVTVRDEHTAELADLLAVALEKRLKRPPFLVIAHFERMQADANRPRECAYESEAAAHYYDAYHAALRDACEQVRNTWGGGILVDLHGKKSEAEALYRGTKNGRTVARLLQRFGSAALSGPSSICGVLAAKGYAILPPDDAHQEDPRYDGGYTVQTYGSIIDALQLELTTPLRRPERLAGMAEDLAEAIGVFAGGYLIR